MLKTNSLNTEIKQLFFVIISLHLVLWTVVPFLLNVNPPIDVVESIVMGQERMMGYAKHPPLAILLTDIAYKTVGSEWAVYLLSQICIVASFILVYLLAKEFLEPNKALLSALILEGVWYYNYTTPEFNPNVLQLPLWAAMCLLFWKAVKHDSFWSWIFFGVVSGLAILTKYFAGILLFIFAILMVITPEGRAQLKKIGPYFSAAAFLIVLFPHIYWLVESGFLTFEYAGQRSTNLLGLFGHFVHPLKFVYSQALALAIPIVLCLIILGRKNLKFKFPTKCSFEKLYPWAISLGPFIFLIMISFLYGTRLRSMWGMPLWNFMGLLFFLSYSGRINKGVFQKFKYSLLFLAVFPVGVYAAVNQVSLKSGIMTPGAYPGEELANAVTEKWNEHYDQKLYFVGGLTEAVSNVSLYSKGDIKMIAGMEVKHNPWVWKHDLDQKGMVILWDLKTKNRPIPPDWLKRYPGTIMMEDKIIIPSGYDNIKPLEFVWAVLPPKQFRKIEEEKEISHDTFCR